jgi:hypothetical protein
MSQIVSADSATPPVISMAVVIGSGGGAKLHSIVCGHRDRCFLRLADGANLH